MTYPSKAASERKADFAVHAVSLVGLIVAGALLIARAAQAAYCAVLIAVLVYVAAILSSVSISFAYHLHPRHEWRATLRRWDHAAIYIVIAGTFSPLLIVAGTWSAHAILSAIWAFAAIGVGFKMLARNFAGRWSLISYLGMGWFGLFALPDFWNGLPGFCTAAIAAGGMFYTVGTLFYRSKTMRFRYPIWHVFGTLGGASFFAAIWVAVGV